MYKIIETNFSVFQDTNKALELFTPDNSVHKIVLLHYTEFEIIALIEFPKKGMEYVPFSSNRKVYLPLDISKDAISFIGTNILPQYWNIVYLLQDFYINHDFSKQIVKQELKHFNLKLKDVPQQFLPTNKFQSKEMPDKYLSEITKLGNRYFARFYDKCAITKIKSFYKLLENHEIEKFANVSNVKGWMDREGYNKAYEHYLKIHPNIGKIITEIEEKQLSDTTTKFMEELYFILYSILTVTDQRIDDATIKLQELFDKITPYTWKYKSLEYDDFYIIPDDVLTKIGQKFGGIYNYRNRQYDYENLWDKRELNNDGSVNMSTLESEIQNLFPDGCYPFSEYKEIEEKSLDHKQPNPRWFKIMQLAENDCYYLDYREIKNRPEGQVIRVIEDKIEVVAQNYLIFMENIMIPKIEELIRNHID